jgi:hypothetical protein
MSEELFTCKRCGYSTIYKQVLIKHLKKRIQCVATINDISVDDLLNETIPSVKHKSHQCTFCMKRFSHPSGLSRHKKSCSLNNDPKDKLIQELQQKLHSFEQQLDDIKGKVSQCKNEQVQTNITGNNNVTINNNNTYVVVVNNFGSEDVSHVMQDEKFLDDCLKTLQIGIPNVVKKIYYDESKPENKTVLLKSAKRKTAWVHTNGKWEEKDLNQVVPMMVRKGTKILSNHLNTKTIDEDDANQQENSLAKHGYIADIVTQKRPEYDIVSSAVKANIYNHR